MYNFVYSKIAYKVAAKFQIVLVLHIGRVIVLKWIKRSIYAKIITHHLCIFVFCNACGYYGFVWIIWWLYNITQLIYQSTCPTLVNTMGWDVWCTKLYRFKSNQYEFEVWTVGFFVFFRFNFCQMENLFSKWWKISVLGVF